MNEPSLPRWEMATIFPSLESSEFATAFDDAIRELDALAARFDECGVRRRDRRDPDDAFIADYEEITGRFNGLLDKMRDLNSYIGCFVSTDARNETALSRESLLNVRAVTLEQLRTRYTAWVGSSDIEELLSRSEVARDHAYPVRRAAELAAHQMSEAEEGLAAELRPSGLTGWSRLHGQVSALLTVVVPRGGEETVLPMSSVRALATDPDREVRRAAFEAELKAWESVSVPMAAALNGIKGFQGALRRHRNYPDDVDPTLSANGIDREILDAMQSACVESFPDFRHYLGAKARALGLGKLAWYDLAAPVGRSSRRWRWPEAESYIRENFTRYSERLAGFAERSFRERWIDAEPRVGKEGGAYCTRVRPGESRVMMNFDGSFLSVSTLAHELGHAYHNLNLADRPPLQSGTPSTLAETASIFCETLTFDAALARADSGERLALLETALQRDLMVVVDIHSRFLFEQAVFERRSRRDLLVSEFNELMLDAQRQTYGDGIELLHPYMWAVKGHYYGPTFYNYPYTFGLLFALGLYSRYREKPEAFRVEYDSFLSSTGMGDARTLASRFGVDVADVAFWQSSLDVIRAEIAEFEALACG